MNVQRLVAMANDISNFFGSDPDPAAAAEQVAGHMKKFWEPRMREEIRRHVSHGRRRHVLDRHPGREATRIADRALRRLLREPAEADGSARHARGGGVSRANS